MREFSCQIHSRKGLHARSAMMLVGCVKSLESTVYLCIEEKKTLVNNPMKIMALHVQYGAIVTFELEGSNEIKDAETLKIFCDNNL